MQKLCSKGCARLRIFKSITKDGHILRLAYEPPQPAISVRLHDLVVLQNDIQQFERIYKISDCKKGKDSTRVEDIFKASDDFRYVKLNDLEFHFGDIQARIIQLLYDASTSHTPWVHSKTLIFESGSTAIRLRDLFKNKKNWSKLVISNSRGYYRLNVPLGKQENNSSIHSAKK